MAPPIKWDLDPLLLGALATYLAIYGWRWRQVRREDGPRAASWWHLASFTLGVGALFVGLVSPIADLGSRLFVFHMAQHIFIADIAAILMILGCTKVILRPITGRLHRFERNAGWLATPVFAVTFYAATLWIWHIPAMYQLGLDNPALHPIQHFSFSIAAFVFWWFILSPVRPRKRPQGMGVVFYIASTKILTGFLAAAITWAPVFLYEYYAEQPRWWGISVREDQAMAGALMMVEESLILTIALVVLFMRMLSESNVEEDRRERYGTEAP